MKLLKKLTLSITALACVLSLAACNDDKKEENGFKDKGKEVEYTEYVEKFDVYQEIFENKEGDFVCIQKSYQDVKFVTDSIEIDAKADFTYTYNYDSTNSVFKERVVGRQYGTLDGVATEELTDMVTIYQEMDNKVIEIYLYDEGYNDAYYDSVSDYANEFVDYILDNLEYSVDSDIDNDVKMSYYVNENIFTIVQEYIGSEDKVKKQTAQIEFNNNSFEIIREIEKIQGTDTNKQHYEYSVEYKDVNVEPIDVSNFYYDN